MQSKKSRKNVFHIFFLSTSPCFLPWNDHWIKNVLRKTKKRLQTALDFQWANKFKTLITGVLEIINKFIFVTL